MKKFIIIVVSLFTIWIVYIYDDIPTEGIRILWHYMFGDGSDLQLSSTYIPTSPVIKEHLKKMKTGETRKVSFRQEKDWRLSYAINGFDLTKTKEGFKIKQYIIFDTTGKVITYINTAIGKIKFYDNWVHVVKCRPFIVYFDSNEMMYTY